MSNARLQSLLDKTAGQRQAVRVTVDDFTFQVSRSRATRMPEIEVSGNERQTLAATVVDHNQDAEGAGRR